MTDHFVDAHKMVRPEPRRLSQEQVDAFLGKLDDPSLARAFLMDAGLIDADGQLSPPYRNQETP